MFQQMFTATEGEGPMGGGAGAGVWRSFLTDEFAKSFAKNGGIGLAEPVYRSLLMHQEAASRAVSGSNEQERTHGDQTDNEAVD